MYIINKPIVILFLLFLVPFSVFPQRSISDLKSSIEKELKKEKITLRIDIQDQEAKLSGSVRNIFEQDQAIAIALEHQEIMTVDIDIEIASAENDNKLGEAVIREVRRYGQFTIFDDAGAIVKNGRVVLFGFVTQPHKKERLEERMHKVLGIIEFRNEIVVLPNSMNDTNLRRTLANRLYRDSLFADFATMALPPINIIVQNSRVLLTGIVHNQLAKTKAEHILRSTPGILGFESRLRIDK